MEHITEILTWSHLAVLAIGYIAGTYKLHELATNKDDD